ncbi:proprotein convertase P-domain-containing protein [Lysobacter brunescens]|uniref:Proprotein convertase P-domain-containing protein n=1 Tax=Lysobacter brunescens TaxID=262323 RepID=A0ABW2YFL3_9GAMM
MKSAMIKGAKAAVLMLLLPCAAMAAQPSGGKANPGRPQIGQPVSAHNIAVDLRNLPKAKPWTPGMGIREAHRRQYTPIGSKLPHAPADKPTARDRLPELQTLWDKSPRARSLKGNVAARSRVSINNPNTGVSPGDPVVEVGANHVIYAVNSGGSGTYFNVYNKSGTLVSGPTTFGSLAPAGNSCTSDRGDPLLHYDRQAGRWFMLTMDDTGLCTFVSKTSDPVSGGWWFYRYATPVLPDYPHCGVWNDAYVCGTNEGSQAGTEIYAFDRANMLNGATARPAQRFSSVANLAGYGFQIMTPSTFYGTTAAPSGRKQVLARHNDDEAHAGASANGSQDFIELYELNIDWNTPANSGITTLPRVAITEFNSWFRDYSTFATVPQPGSTSRLDPIREVLLNQLVYRNMGTHEALVGTLATNQDPARSGTVVDSGVRWFELRRVGSGNWTLHQEGTFSPGDSSTHHLMGTIAMDKFGNIGMGYNVTKTTTPTKFATLGYTGRTAADPAGVMSLGENEVAVGAAVETSGRWGDYYQMTVDPVDDCTFWFVGMYRPSGSWQTRIADFKFPACTGGGGTTYSISGTIATSGGTGISGVSVSNGSTSVTTNASGQYTFSGLANGTYTLTPSLSGYTFSPTSLAVTVNGANVTGQNFTGTASATTFSVSGTISNSGGTGISGVSVSNGSTSVTTNASGQFTFSNLANGTYTLTPSLSGYTFSPATRSVTVSGANVTGQNFTGTATSGGTTLTKGVPVTGLGASTGNSLNYTMVVPAGATNLTFTMSGGTGDADLYVKFGSAPTDTVYDCRPYLGGNAETCTIAAPQAGTYYVRVKAYSTFSGVSLVGDYSTGGGGSVQTYTNGTDVAISDNATVQSTITVSGRSGNAPTSTPVAVAIVHTYIGDLKVDLIAPDGSVYVLHNRTGGSADNINQTYTVNLSSEPLNGTWTLRVNDNAGGDTGRIDSWSITF